MNDTMEREVPVLHMVVNDGTKIDSDLIKKIDERITTKCSEPYVPKYYIIRKAIPYTETNKKMDYRALEAEDIFGPDFDAMMDRVFIHK